MNKNQSNYIQSQNMEESEYSSEYILDIPDDRSEKVNETENKSICDNSTNQIKSKQTNVSPKSEHPKKIELSPTQSPYSLLVHPNKSRHQSSNKSNNIINQKNVEESETASEHVLEAPDDSSEKAIFTKRFVLASNQGQKSSQFKHTEKVNSMKSPTKTPSSSLSNLNPTKSQSSMKYVQNLTDKSKFKQETIEKQSEKAIFTKRFVIDDNQPQRNTQSRQQEKAEHPIKVSKSLSNQNQNQQNMKCDLKNQEESVYILTIQDEQTEKLEIDKKFTTHCEQPEKSEIDKKFTTHCEQPEKSEIDKKFTTHCEQPEKKGTSNQFNRQSFSKNDQEDTEFSSDCILEELEEKIGNWNKSEYNEFASSSEISFNSSQLNTLMKSKQIGKVESPGSFDKTKSTLLKKQTITKDDQTSVDESQFSTVDDQSEKAIVTEKFLIANIQLQETMNLKQQKSSEKMPVLSYRNKNEELSKMKCNQKSTEESEYILKIPEEQNEEPIIADTKPIQQEKVEKSKSPIKNHCSFLLHQPINQNQSNMKCYRKLNEESEVTSEYILEEPASDQLEKNVSTKKLALSNNQKQETVEQQKPSEKTPCSISLLPNKNNEQLNTKCSQKEAEESESESAKAIVTQKFLLRNLQTQRDLSTSQADEIVEPSTPSKVSNSHQAHQNKINYHHTNEYNEVIESEALKKEREKCQIKTSSPKNQIVIELNNQVVKAPKNQIDNEQKNQVFNEPRYQINKSPKSQIINEQNKQTIKEQKNQVINEPRNQINQVVSEPKKQVVSEPKKQVVSEQKNHVVNEQNKTQQKKKSFVSTYDPSVFYNDSIDITRCTFEFQNQPINDNVNATPNKSNQLSFIKINKANMDESEYTSEYILKMPNEQPEKAHVAEKSNLPNDKSKENTKSTQQEKASPSKSPVKKPDSPLSAHPNKCRQQIFRKNNQTNIKESENTCEYRLEIPNEKPEKEEQLKSPIKTPNSIPIKQENKQKTSNIKRNQKSVKETEYASVYMLKLPNEQQEKVTLTEKFILPNDQPKENTKPTQPRKFEQSKSPTKTPYLLPIQTEKSRKPSYIKLNQKATDESEYVSEYILVMPEEPSAKTETTKKFILPNNQELQNKTSKQQSELLPKSSNKDSYSSLMLQGNNKHQIFTKRNPKIQEECTCEYILEIPKVEEQTEKAIDTKKSTQSKDQTSLLLINNTKDSHQMKQNNNKSELSTKFQIKKETVNDKVEPTKQSFETSNSINKIKQQPTNQEPQTSPQYHLIELEEQIEKWCRSEFLEFASSSEKIFNSSLSSINPKLTQTEKVEQIKIQDKPSCSLIEIPNETKLQAITNDNDLLPETTEESYSEKTIVTQKFLLCNLKTQQNLNTQTDEIIEPVIPSKITCSHLLLPSNANADHQYYKINFLPLSEYDDEIESEALKKEIEKCQIKTSSPRNQIVIELNNQVVKAPKNQIDNEQKNQVINEQRNQINKSQKNQIVSEQNKQTIKEQKSQVFNEPRNQINKTQKSQVVTEQNKQVIKDKKSQVVNEEKKKTHQKQKTFVSAYDPSIFYNDSNDVSRCKFEFQKHHHIKNNVVSPPSNKMPITVSLKDIGLEGFDSNNIEKINEMKNKSRIIIHVDGLSEKNRDKIEPNPKSEIVCKLSPYERKDKLISSIKKVEPYFALFSLSDEQNNVVGSNLKPASLLDSTQKAQKIQAIKPKASPKNCQKSSKSGSFSSSYDEYQLSTFVCRSPRRYKSPNNDF